MLVQVILEIRFREMWMYVRGKDGVMGRLVDYLLFELEYVCGYLWRCGPVCVIFILRMCGTVFCVWKGDRIRAIFRDDG